MFDQLLNMFGQSRQGQAAYTQLQAQGYTPQQSAGILTTAFPAAFSAMQNAMQGNGQGGMGLLDITQSNYGTNFLSAAVTGLLRGEGIKGAAIDGVQGVVGGHVAQVIASRCGLPQRVAGTVGAIITPIMVDFIWEKVQPLMASGGGFSALLGSGASMLGGGAPAQQPQQAAPQGFGSNFTPFGAR